MPDQRQHCCYTPPPEPPAPWAPPLAVAGKRAPCASGLDNPAALDQPAPETSRQSGPATCRPPAPAWPPSRVHPHADASPRSLWPTGDRKYLPASPADTPLARPDDAAAGSTVPPASGRSADPARSGGETPHQTTGSAPTSGQATPLAAAPASPVMPVATAMRPPCRMRHWRTPNHNPPAFWVQACGDVPEGTGSGSAPRAASWFPPLHAA